MIQQQVTSRFAPRSLIGMLTQASSNPEDISRPQSPQRFLATARMLTDGAGREIAVGLDDGSVKSGALLTDEPIFQNQMVWVSPTSNPSVIGIHGSVR